MINLNSLPDTIEIRQKPDENAQAIGLAKYNRSKYPKCVDSFQVAEYQGRYITGIDEDAYDISRIKDATERMEEKETRKEIREFLEAKLNKDLSATSSFWENFSIDISSDSPLILSKDRALDIIAFYALIANQYIAPSKADKSKPQFLQCKYYAHFQESETKEDVSVQKKRDKARSKLLEISEDKDLMLLVGQYLEGFKFHAKLGTDTIYTKLSEFINKDKRQLELFVKAAEMPIADLQFKVNIDKAIKKGIIKFSNKYFQRGEITYGKTIEEIYKKLKKPEMAVEYMSLKEELDNE